MRGRNIASNLFNFAKKTEHHLRLSSTSATLDTTEVVGDQDILRMPKL